MTSIPNFAQVPLDPAVRGVLAVVGDEVVEREAVVAGDEVDALQRPGEEVGAALHPLDHGRHVPGLGAQEGTDVIAEAIVPLQPPRLRLRQLSHISNVSGACAGMVGCKPCAGCQALKRTPPTPGNQVRAGIRLATVFKKLGIDGLNTDYDPHALPDRAVELLMRTLPFRHIYDSPVARRIYFVYGDVYQWENINRDTMEQAVPAFFGNGNITFFEHISLMIRASAARNARGEDVYLANADAYRLPMSFMTGEHNRMFVPKGLQRTYDHLRNANGSEYYTHRVFKDYAHLDCWLGTDAERDVWPTALAELEKHN